MFKWSNGFDARRQNKNWSDGAFLLQIWKASVILFLSTFHTDNCISTPLRNNRGKLKSWCIVPITGFNWLQPRRICPFRAWAQCRISHSQFENNCLLLFCKVDKILRYLTINSSPTGLIINLLYKNSVHGFKTLA